MGKRVIFEKEAEFIIENRLSMSMRDMAKHLGISRFAISSYLERTGHKPRPGFGRKFSVNKLKGRSIMTAKQDEILKKHLLDMPVKTLARKIGVSSTVLRKRIDQLGLVIPREIIEKRKRDSQLKKGNIPPLKGKKMDQATRERFRHTWFQKGNEPVNALSDGDITIRHDRGDKIGGRPYKYIRISKGRWEQLHRFNWRKTNGPIPKGHVVAFKDGDSLNCDLENLELITREENMLRNSIQRWWSDDTAKTMALISKVKKSIKKSDQKNGKQ